MRLCALTLAAMLAGPLAAGCGAGRDAGTKQIDELKQQISKLRAEQAALTDRIERAEIELRNAKQPKALPPGVPAARASAEDRPDLEVVHLGPEADNDDPDADTPRPVLRANGNSGVIQERAGGKVLMDDRKEREDGDAGKKKPPFAAKKPGIKAPAEKKKQP